LLSFTDDRVGHLIDMAEALVRQVIRIDQCTLIRNPEVVELLADYRIDRMSCGARYLLVPNQDLDDAIHRFGRHLLTGVPASDRRWHANLYRHIVELASRSDFANLKYARQEVQAIIKYMEDKDTSTANKAGTTFMRWHCDNSKQSDFDINTILARLYETDAKLLLIDNILNSRTLLSKNAQRIADLLGRAETAFRRSSGIWWHGYGNMMLTEAVLASYTTDYEQNYGILLRARDIFRRTNDLMRANMVSDIIEPGLKFLEVGLNESKMRLLLFGE
jgi:hypothetical protein